MKSNGSRKLLRTAGTLAWALVIGTALAGLTGCNTLQSVEINGTPAKTVYGQGQDFDPTGLGAAEYYKKEGDVRPVSSRALTVTGYDRDRPGEQTVIVSYRKKRRAASAVFSVTVIPVERVSIARPPATTTYKQGADFDPTGLLVTVTFQGGAAPEETVGPNRLTLAGYRKDAGGVQTITVDYYGKQAAFEVQVAALIGITVGSPPDRTEYFIGEDLSAAGLVVFGDYEGLGEEAIPVTRANLSSYDKNRAGEQQVVVTYLGKSTKFSVTWVAMSAIKVDTPPARLEYENGEPLDLAGIVVMGTRQGASSIELLDPSRLAISGYDRFKPGSQTITVTIGGKSAVFKVTVGPIPFVGTWRGTWDRGLTGGAVERGAITLIMTENTWALTAVVTRTTPADGKADGKGDRKADRKEFSFSGTYTRDADTGKRAALQALTAYWDGNAAPTADAPRSAEILSPAALKLTGGRNYGQGAAITLARR